VAVGLQTCALRGLWVCTCIKEHSLRSMAPCVFLCVCVLVCRAACSEAPTGSDVLALSSQSIANAAVRKAVNEATFLRTQVV
jgi:hypothetical protein